jgi:hypothetical protein
LLFPRVPSLLAITGSLDRVILVPNFETVAKYIVNFI